jgi:chromosome segregation ATPase
VSEELRLPSAVCDRGGLAGSFVTYRANARREAIRQLAELRTRLDAAEDVLTAAEASLKQAHTRFDAADDQVAAAEDALHAAYADREAARRERFAARQAHERASAVVERLQRRVSELTGRLAKMP